MPHFFPDSLGADDVKVFEFNPCHSKADGKFSAKGQGQCAAGVANVDPSRYAPTVVGVVPRSAEAELLGGKTAEEVARAMVADSDFTTFRIIIKGEGGSEFDDEEDAPPDRDDREVRRAYDHYVEEALGPAEEAAQREQQDRYRGYRERTANKIDSMLAEVANDFEDLREERRAEIAAHAKLAPLFSHDDPNRPLPNGADFERALAGKIREIFERNGRVDNYGHDAEDLYGRNFRGFKPEERAELREFMASHPFLQAGAGHFPVIRSTSPAFSAWHHEMDHRPDEDGTTGIDRWVERQYPEGPDYTDYGVKNFSDWYEGTYPTARNRGYNAPATIDMDFRGADGTHFSRSFYKNSNGEIEVHHNVFKAGDMAPDGAGKDVLRASVRAYKQMGVDKVTTDANIDVGSYAWARYGFIAQQPQSIVSQARNRLEGFKQGESKTIFYNDRGRDANGARTTVVREAPLTKQIIDEVEGVLHNMRSNPKVAWRLSDIRHPDDETFSVGKALLMDTYWGATLDLRDREHMARFEKYVGLKFPPKKRT